MELSTAINKEKGVLTVYAKGPHQRPDDAFEVLRFVIDSFPEHECTRILVDLTEAEIIGSLADNYHAAHPSDELAEKLRKLRFAVVSSEVTDNDEFFENIAYINGYRVRFFDDHKFAMAWLENDKTSPDME